MWAFIENIIKVRINAHNIRVLVAELIGTCMIVLFGCGSVCASLSGAYKGIWQIAVIWGLGVSFAIYCTCSISNAHLNPAVSLAFFLWRPEGTFKLECIDDNTKNVEDKNVKADPDFYHANVSSTNQVDIEDQEEKVNMTPKSKEGNNKNKIFNVDSYISLLPSLVLYSIFQLLGGILGGIINLIIYGSTIESFERKNNITRGDEKSILTAKAFGEYFPNPDLSTKYNPSDGIYEQSDVSVEHGLFIEAWGTFVLVFVIFVLTNAKNGAVKMKFGGERQEDMKKNMYCVCVEIEDGDNRVDPEEEGILLEDMNIEAVAQYVDKKSTTSTCIPIPALKSSSTSAARKNSIFPISVGQQNNESKTSSTIQSIPSVVIPGLIGFTVAMNLALYAPLTQAGWNPARDFGPRVVAYFAGWGNVAIPGPRGGFWIYIVGPYIGGTVAGFVGEKMLYGFKS